ncbi:hypothetical protein C900_05640 [Fulvivirga imtechensis AK7]|uniref:Uncharacterized protein n=1 Tax=Fulvivirga imtechensis AK7 TaxID=1237149 RepID=L8JNJ5_9BACT|nr:hypothetical protein [Fulvivirga imtechensis]ELR68947.1 hypothetical protein C900_05640 [Fulvivirga imtechensis AK7]
MFTEKEIRYLSDKDFLLTKRVVIEKVVNLFAELEASLKKEVEHTTDPFPSRAFLKAGKISKGENFRGLPYVILDYPRLFSKEAVFAYRTMFWWGNFFSNTLHVSGAALEYFPKRQIVKYPLPLYLQTSGDPWDHSLDSAEEVGDIQMTSLTRKILPFVKLTQKISLGNYDQVKNLSLSFFQQLFV